MCLCQLQKTDKAVMAPRGMNGSEEDVVGKSGWSRNASARKFSIDATKLMVAQVRECFHKQHQPPWLPNFDTGHWPLTVKSIFMKIQGWSSRFRLRWVGAWACNAQGEFKDLRKQCDRGAIAIPLSQTMWTEMTLNVFNDRFREVEDCEKQYLCYELSVQIITRCKWWMVPTVWGPVVVWCQVKAMEQGLPTSALPVALLVGFIFWTFLEYVIHRFLFNAKSSPAWSVCMTCLST